MLDLEKMIKELEASKWQIEQEKARSDALFTSIGEGVIATDEEGRISHINKIALEIFSYKEPYELIGKWYPKTIIAEDLNGNEIATIKRPITKAFLAAKPISERVIFRRKDGTKVHVALTVSPIILDGKPIGAIQVFRDITIEKQIEQAKDEFISLTSHQLRTPLTSIRLFAELLSDKSAGKLNALQKNYLDKISSSTDRMIQLVGEILNISRIELGRIQVNPELTSITETIKNCIEEIEPVAKSKNIKIALKIKGDNIPKFKYDTNLINQVVHNLLTNAIRYSKSQNARIDLTVMKAGQWCQISVSDNGIGIPEEVKPRIFDRFFRAENAKTVAADGTGLGLYLVKIIVEMAGGRVWFESKVDKGTTFYFSLPLRGMKKRVNTKIYAKYKN